MKVRPSGDFDVEPVENITFTVKRKNTPCKAGFDCQGWQNCGSVTSPGADTKVKTCTAVANSEGQSTCTVTVDFRNDEAGTFDPSDQYSVMIAGSEGGSFTDTFTPPPVLNAQTYTFFVE